MAIGPTSVPADLTLPPPAYRRRLFLALGGLVLFAGGSVAL